MNAFDVLGDPVRREILRLLAISEQPAGGRIVARDRVARRSASAAVSQHLKVLRESGFVSARAEGTRRIYAVDPAPTA